MRACYSESRAKLACFWFVVSRMCVGATAAAAAAAAPGVVVQDLSNSTWSLANRGGNVSLNARLPGYILASLEDAGIVGDPLRGYADLDVRWVAMDDWTYGSMFNASQALFDHETVELVLSGVDTVADVSLGGEPVGELRNAAREHRINVKQLLKRGANNIEIHFQSAPLFASAQQAQYNAQHDVMVPVMKEKGMLAPFNFIRKRPSDLGWNIGPAFAAQGVSGTLHLQAYSTPFLHSALLQQYHGMPGGRINVTLSASLQTPSAAAPELTAAVGDAWDGEVTVQLPELGFNVSRRVAVPRGGGLQSVNVTFQLDGRRLQLWWPTPLGRPHLYNMTVTFRPQGPHQPSTLSYRVGFRDIQLGLDPVPLNGSRDGGETFYLRVNGAPLYIKGANVAPLHFLPTRVGEADVEEVVEAAALAHMNMLRVWGGGGFQPDRFYQLCDERGILVMQDFMFSASPYPAHEEFMANVLAEVEYNVRRLGNHPSIALWAGSNEVNAALYWTHFDSAPVGYLQEHPAKFRADYTALFLDGIGGLLRRLDPQRPYWDCSPSKGWWDEARTEKRWEDVTNRLWGINHYWDKHYDNGDCQDRGIYPGLRFVAEWGINSATAFGAVKHVSSSEDWDPNSSWSQHRNRAAEGTDYAYQQLGYHFKLPQVFGSDHMEARTRYYKAWIYFTQVQQAECMSSAIQRWHSHMADPAACTMGLLYWQLNGLWPTSNDWSSINYGSNWKPSHHAAQRHHAPLTLLTIHAGAAFQLFGVNDLPVAVPVAVERDLLDWGDQGCRPAAANGSGGSRRRLPDIAVELPPLSSVLLYKESIEERLPTGWRQAAGDAVDPWSAFMRLTLRYSSSALDQAPEPGSLPSRPACQRNDTARTLPAGSLNASELDVEVVRYWQPSLFKDLQLRDPAIKLSNFTQMGPGKVSFTASSSFPAGLVLLETTLQGTLSENGFHLHPCYPVSLTFTAARGGNVTARELQEMLTVTSVFDQQEQLSADVAALEASPPVFSHVKYDAASRSVQATPWAEDFAGQAAQEVVRALAASYAIRSALDNPYHAALVQELADSPARLGKVLSLLPPKYGARLTPSTPLNLSTPIDVTSLFQDIAAAYTSTLPSPPPMASPPPPPAPSPPPAPPPLAASPSLDAPSAPASRTPPAGDPMPPPDTPPAMASTSPEANHETNPGPPPTSPGAGAGGSPGGVATASGAGGVGRGAVWLAGVQLLAGWVLVAALLC